PNGQPVTVDPAGALLRVGAPDNDNARDSLLAAQHSDASYLGLPAAVDRFVDASADAAVRNIRAGDDKQAVVRVNDAMKVAEAARQAKGNAVGKLRKRVTQALLARIEIAAAAFDRDSAQQVVESARTFGLSRAQLQQLSARAGDIPQPGERLDKVAGDMVLVRDGDAVFAASRHPVTRDEYARFASATGREPARCRASGSLLRVLAPRDWKSPGFTQSGDQPVVCVSWDDASAYARWLGQRNGHAYRLPHAREAAVLPAAGGGKQVSAWNSDCSGNCSRRIGSGASWRGGSGARALESSRGYDDVGIRLVSDLPHAPAAR
ncbi:MAG: formylglycine-generating enzyme family protein, partial [Luteimonas sp.]|nr:formylglycine-generating enzyme family protein [Luteimonas sp.]